MAVTLQPSDRFRKIVKAYPSTYAAAQSLGIHNQTLENFLVGKGISGDAVAQIVESTRLSYDSLFEHVAETKGKR